MPATDKYRSILQQYWGYDDFRGIQYDIISHICQGRDTLGLMPTGGGKSITFQVPALAMEGVCIVITPLIALMKDQVNNLRSRGIKATAIYSGLSQQEILVALENCIFGQYKLLYVSPERLQSELFQTKLRHMRVSFITVDEAHCISQWGYDFRPSYLHIRDIRQMLPGTPVLALTATATPEVVQDIQQQLGFAEPCCYRMSFERKNLTYSVRQAEAKMTELRQILLTTQGSTIIYSRSRRQCRELSDILASEGFTSTYYHAGLTNSEKDQRQQRWQNDEIRIMVATNAFGMGIDKPDVRLVLHVEMPDSIEAYFQEAGRAGRDGQEAQAILICDHRDQTQLKKRISETYPQKELIHDVYEHLAYYLQMAMGDGLNVTREFNLSEFCVRFKHFPVQTYSALKLLSRAGYIDYTEEDESTSRLMFIMDRNELYKIQDEYLHDRIINTLLRSYSGVFSEYVFIDEDFIAKQNALTANEVYNALITLSKRRVIDYIPRKRTSYITYLCRRVEKDHIVLPKEVYEDRKAQYEKRINCMIEYAAQGNVCRSQYLLAYFGEDNARPCGKCDVCSQSAGTTANLEEIILQYIRDNGPLRPTQFYPLQIERKQLADAIQKLCDREILYTDDLGRFCTR